MATEHISSYFDFTKAELGTGKKQNESLIKEKAIF